MAEPAADPPTAMAAPSRCGPFPHEFGRYRLLEYLGGGGMGAVYLAEDRMLEIKVALKVPHPTLADDPKLLDRFYREARAAARLEHPGLCWVLDVGQICGTPYFVMRYIAGYAPVEVLFPAATRRRQAGPVGRPGDGRSASAGDRPSRPEAREHHRYPGW